MSSTLIKWSYSPPSNGQKKYMGFTRVIFLDALKTAHPPSNPPGLKGVEAIEFGACQATTDMGRSNGRSNDEEPNDEERLYIRVGLGSLPFQDVYIFNLHLHPKTITPPWSVRHTHTSKIPPEIKVLPSPETNILHLKMGGWKTRFLLW